MLRYILAQLSEIDRTVAVIRHCIRKIHFQAIADVKGRYHRNVSC